MEGELLKKRLSEKTSDTAARQPLAAAGCLVISRSRSSVSASMENDLQRQFSCLGEYSKRQDRLCSVSKCWVDTVVHDITAEKIDFVSFQQKAFEVG